MSSPLILVTGASGYLGAHIVQEALQAGYRIRVTVRPGKIEAVKLQFENKVEVEPIADLIQGDYSEALKGVDAVIHSAAPLVGKEKPEDMLKYASEGALNLVRQATKAGIKRVIVTSSIAAVHDATSNEQIYSKTIFSYKDWFAITRESALASGTGFFTVYAAAKALAELDLWKFSDEHPEVDITTVNPPFIYGPLPRNIHLESKEAIAKYSTFGTFYRQLLQEPGAGEKFSHPQAPPPIPIDVRDVARAHILALKAPLTQEVGRKRILISGPRFTWVDATEHLRVSHPGLAEQGRLKDAGTGKSVKELTLAQYDNGRAESVLGLKEFIPWERTVDDTINSILDAEKRFVQ